MIARDCLGSVRWILAGLVVLLLSGTSAAEPRETQALKKAAVDGKYARLLSAIHVPGDKDQYGEFYDYGPYDGSEWAGYSGLPSGNWVYVYPHWYIWDKEGRGKGGAIHLAKASVEGAYSNLLAIIHVPGDKGVYGEMHDYGRYEGTSWAGYSGLPKGNWVYVYPHWYIWEKSSR